ncbi:MAG: hypothetical protein PVI09_00565 [Anaerolineae bacterium]|jgi:hypothetical protein
MSVPKETRNQKDYVSYMLRMWRDRGDEKAGPSEEAPWRASLQSPRTGEMVGFASLDDLLDYLRARGGGMQETVRYAHGEQESRRLEGR